MNAYHTDVPNRSSKLDLSQLAQRIVVEAIAEQSITPNQSPKDQAALEPGRLGRKKGGKTRAEKLTSERRSKIAKIIAQKRWGATESTVNEGDEQIFQKKRKRGVIPNPDF